MALFGTLSATTSIRNTLIKQADLHEKWRLDKGKNKRLHLVLPITTAKKRIHRKKKKRT